jgi:glycosyltransferase involved in cell wall biosynthesis
MIRYHARMKRLVRETGARLVHCNDVFGWMHCGAGARLGGARLVFNVRDTKPGGKYRVHWKLAHRFAHATIVLSQEMARDLAVGLGVRQETMTTIYSVVDTGFGKTPPPSRETLRKSLCIPSGCIAVGCVGVISEKKNQLNLIRETLARLPETDLPLHFFFIGDCEPTTDPYARECVEAVRQLGLTGRVTFVGYSPEVFRWYRALDLTMMASGYEGLARAMIESLACGTPAISFDVCSAREILEQRDCGVVIPAGDYAAFGRELLALAGDPERRVRFGARGESIAQELFDPEAVVRQYDATYRKVLA